MSSCLAAVKASMLVIQRSQETISAALQAEPGSGRLEEILSDLLGCYVHILTDGDRSTRANSSLFSSAPTLALWAFLIVNAPVKHHVCLWGGG